MEHEVHHDMHAPDIGDSDLSLGGLAEESIFFQPSCLIIKSSETRSHNLYQVCIECSIIMFKYQLNYKFKRHRCNKILIRM